VTQAPLWEKWVREFATCDAVADLAPHIPVASPQLAAGAYEAALLSLLDGNGAAASVAAATGAGARRRELSCLVERVRAWPPCLYAGATVARAVARAAAAQPGGVRSAPLLMETLALLHCHSGHHQAALMPSLQQPPPSPCNPTCSGCNPM
tara:strand:- start:530 stop:982 length:453 start_codon:yes stop_codon:yes gene_type:complete